MIIKNKNNNNINKLSSVTNANRQHDCNLTKKENTILKIRNGRDKYNLF